MKNISFLLLFLPFLSQNLFSQTTLPMIKSNNADIYIREQGSVEKTSWQLTPSAKPDIYVVNSLEKNAKVTFVTDVDSISFVVKPNKKYDFVILLNGKDSCFMRVQSPLSNVHLSKKNFANLPHVSDTLPFHLTPYNNILVKTVVNQQDTLELMFHTAVSAISITKEGLAKTHINADKKITANAWGGSAQSALSQGNTVQIGNLKQQNVALTVADLSGQGSDGKFGYDWFQNKILEINYDKNILVAHSHLPKSLNGYAKLPLTYANGSYFLEANMKIAGKTYKEPVLLHTGYSGALILEDAFLSKNNLWTKFDTLGVQVLLDSYGHELKNVQTKIPFLKVGKTVFAQQDILLRAKGASNMPISVLGNGLLKRFNILIDYQSNYIYLKENKLRSLSAKKT